MTPPDMPVSVAPAPGVTAPVPAQEPQPQKQPVGHGAATLTASPGWLPLALELRSQDPPLHWNRIANRDYMEGHGTISGRDVKVAVEAVVGG